MEAEDPRLAIEARIRARTTVRPSTCATCDWIEEQSDPDFWDRLMDLPTKHAGHFALHEEMTQLGFSNGRKAVESHRNKGHRRASD